MWQRREYEGGRGEIVNKGRAQEEEVEEGLEEGEGLEVEEGEGSSVGGGGDDGNELLLYHIPNRGRLPSSVLPSSRWLAAVVLHGNDVLRDEG